MSEISNDTTGVNSPTSEDGPKTQPDIESWSDRLSRRLRCIGEAPPLRKERPVLPENNGSAWAHLTFADAFRILRIANFRALFLEDFDAIHPSNSLEAKLQLFKETFGRGNESWRIYYALFRCYRGPILWSSFCHFVKILCHLGLSVALRYFAIYIFACHHEDPDEQPSVSHGVWLVLLMISMSQAALLGELYSFKLLSHAGTKIKGLLGNLVSEKQFRISPRATDLDGLPWTTGALLSMLNSDTDRVSKALPGMHYIWSSVYSLPIFTLLSYWYIGPLTFVGLGSILLLIPISWLFSHVLTIVRRKTDRLTDRRVNLVNDVILGARFIKYYAWEATFLDLVTSVRSAECRSNQYSYTLQTSALSLGSLVARFPTIFIFIIQYVRYGELDVVSLLPFWALFVAYFRSCTRFIPQHQAEMVNTLAALRRVQCYLKSQEDVLTVSIDSTQGSAIDLVDAQFKWIETQESPSTKSVHDESTDMKQESVGLEESEATETTPLISEGVLATKTTGSSAINIKSSSSFCLSPINVSFRKDELVAIVGSVGSGKSSLLAGITSEMSLVSGRATLSAHPSHAPQIPWIQNATVRENIIFGCPYEPERYARIVQACALPKDFASFAQGDLSELGEQGIDISGGQKQRIHVARVIYQGSSIVLLDDPLAALDSSTGYHLFEQAIRRELRGTCRLLVTHQLHLLQRCDRVLWMENGKIRSLEPFEVLIKNQHFVRFMNKQQQQPPSEEIDVTEVKFVPQPNEEVTSVMESEEMLHNSITWGTYVQLVRASGTFLTLAVFLFLVVASQVFYFLSILAYAWWADDTFHLSSAGNIALIIFTNFGWLITYGSSLALVVNFFVEGARQISGEAMKGVLHAPMAFFDTTPVGRLLNRFTSDINTIDNELPDALRWVSINFAYVVSMFLLFIVYLPIIMMPTLVWLLISAYILFYYKAGARQVKRVERIHTSFWVTTLNEGILGRSSFRSAQRVPEFIAKLRSRTEDVDSINFFDTLIQCWTFVRTDIVSAALFLFLGLTVVYYRHSLEPAATVVLLANGAAIGESTRFMLTTVLKVQLSMNSFQRLEHYRSNLPNEGIRHKPGFNTDNTWPMHGAISLQNVCMRYRPGLPMVIKNLSLDIAAGMKVGVVGRTGAGKSSLLTLIERLVPLADDKILIDGVDTATIGTHDLRSRIAIIPQDPMLFNGSIRFNLYPSSEDCPPDSELIEALRQTSIFNSQPHLTLDTHVDSGGLNFSAGERQLLMLARAIVRKASIIFCDEATSACDSVTDARIQNALRTVFRERTVISIAHRIATVANFDRVAVMEDGAVAEWGAPADLWRKGGIFRDMCDRSRVYDKSLTGIRDD